MINVTKPYLPPLEKYQRYVERIWERNHLTNQGPLLLSLEARLRDYLNLGNFMAVSNGTIALQLAIKALGVEGEVITTPFSYVATTNSILWEKCNPVFVDINPQDCCIDVEKIEAAITEKTTAIMAVHVYGIPCDVVRIQEIARRHNLKVIYDAAHAFGVTINGNSVLSYGDVSTLSFHATKLFHTIEGGGVHVPNSEVYEALRKYGTFGHVGDDYYLPGINAKMNEFCAAMGHCVLDDIQEIIATRKHISDLYSSLLDHSILQRPTSALDKSVSLNYSYYPLIFPDELTLLKTISRLNTRGVYPRRYFYPSLNTLPFLDKQPCPVSEDIAPRVLCIPLYPGLTDEEVKGISDTIIQTLS